MKGSSGRTESRLYRTGIYIVLVLGALPILLPVYWMLLASLKSRERTAVNPPDWLPVDVRHTVRIAGQDVLVTILDDAAASQTGVYRVKMKHDAPDLPRIPRNAIAAETHEDFFAEVAGIDRRVEPLAPVPADGEVEVLLPGTRRSVAVPARTVEIAPETHTYWSVLGQDLPVHLTDDRAPDASVCTILLPPDTPPLRIAPDLYHAGDPGRVLWHGRPVAARQLSSLPESGCLLVQLVNPADGLHVPAAELRRETRVRRYAVIDGARREVKTLEDLPNGQIRVEILDEPQRARVPAAQLRTVRRTAYSAPVLGEPHEVEPAVAPLPDNPDALIPVFVPGALAVAAARVYTATATRPQWENFTAAWREQSFDLYVANTLFIAALVVLGTVLSCGLVGYAFARLEFRGRDALFLLLLATMMIPGQVTSIPTFVMYVKFGWIDTYQPLIVPSFLACSAFFVFLFRQFLLTIPNDLEDAARIDGCGPLATWWLIMMPLSKPIIVTVAVFAFTGVWNDFLAPLLYINSDEKQTVALGLQSFKSAFSAEEPQLMMAASVMMIVPTVVLFFLAQRAFIRGVVVSGVKG